MSGSFQAPYRRARGSGSLPRVLKRALPPVALFLSACTSPTSPEPARAPAAASPTAQVIDRKPAPPAPSPVGGVRVEAAPQAPPVIDRKPMPEAAAPVVAADPTRALFVANCAQCHGEKGDGEGVTQLDRKARSFLEGGFSYGNTKDAIVRSITHGIPGTPMPSFEKALTVEQRAALADYVIALGPERLVVDPSESEMVVEDKPLVVRGKLPPLVEGGPEIPRGLAIGTPDGLTFEYRADDVQLVRVRAGRFVNRADWNDRGGQALEMLGGVVLTFRPQWNPAQLSLVGIGADQLPADVLPRHAQLLATEAHGDRASVEYRLTSGAGSDLRSVLVREHCAAFRNRFGSGIRVTSTVRAEKVASQLAIGDLESTRSSAQTLRGSVQVGPYSPSASNKQYLIVSRALPEHPNGGRALRHSPVIDVSTASDVVIDVFVLTDLTTSVDLQDNAQLEQLFKEFGL